MFKTPILLIVFNRPDLTQRVFEAIRRMQPTQLYVAADGPRKNIAKDEENCNKCLEVIQQVDWPCAVNILKQPENLGCGRAVSKGITWFFNHVDQGIILEDDCIPENGFFHFCEALLDRYKDNPTIMHIGGTNFQDGQKRNDASYYFSAIPHVWGWASWKRAWALYNFDITDLEEFKKEKKIKNYFEDQKIVEHWLHIFDQMQAHAIDTWDHQWSYTIWKNKGLTIIPEKNLIANIGFRSDATHTIEDSPFANMQTFAIGKIEHPQLIEQNKIADYYTFITHHQQQRVSIIKRIYHKIIRLLK